jgi:mono/diheme cytochrome c family protein
MNTHSLCLFACLMLVAGAGSVHAQVVDTTKKGAEPDSALLTPENIDAGRKIFHGQGACHACHGDKLQGGPLAPALTGGGWRHIKGTFETIVDRIDTGLPGTLMVPRPGRITQTQVFLVAAYVYSVSHGLAQP